jgi:phosphatidylglycerophosphatase A
MAGLGGVARLIASGGGCGHAPLAPGTVGSAVAVALGAALLAVAPGLLPVAALLALAAGLWAIPRAGVAGDPGWVVIDEFAGQFLALCGLARPGPAGLLAAFLLFRLLDIAKPGPIGWADRQGGAGGIMADDAIAGAIAAAVLLAIRGRWPDVLG